MYQVRKLDVNLEVATVVQMNVKQVLALLFPSGLNQSSLCCCTFPSCHLACSGGNR